MPSALTVHAVQQGTMAFTISDGAHEVSVDQPVERVEYALTLSETTICPVWAMLKAGTPVTNSCTVVKA